MLKRIYIMLLSLACLCSRVEAQHQLHPAMFNLQEVTLLDGPFKTAQDLNFKALLDYDTDRLLTPYIRQAGLSMTSDQHSRYYQWEYKHPAFDSFAWPSLSLDGHILSHYLSALSMASAACHDEMLKKEYLRRVDYILTVLKDCQDAFDGNKVGLKGFIGGVPDNDIWTALFDADYRVYVKRGNWIPFYTESKVMASLRDAYLYTGDERAKEMLRKMCEWLIRCVGLFSNDVMEMQILTWESSNMNEVLADASELLGDSKYMKAAQKFSHQIRIENMNSDPQHDFLDQKHATDMSAMMQGISRVGTLRKDNRYLKSARLYWDDVVNRRSVANGGVGVLSYFPSASKGSSVITSADGPEFCTTYYMLKLTQQLFMNQRNAKYTDYYEKALLNHVLASQDPETGGTCFYTPMRPGSYRMYSKANESMWCCMGTGIESYTRLGDFIYTQSQDTVFVNLFIPSELNAERVGLKQEGNFPYSETTRITVTKSGNYQLAVRHPSWANDGFKVTVNGKAPKGFRAENVKAGDASYIACGKSWKAGDVVEITYPMTLTFEYCPHYTDYIALRYGPSLLAAPMSQSSDDSRPGYEVLRNEYGGEGREDHVPSTRQDMRALSDAPMLICELYDVPKKVELLDKEKLVFRVNVEAPGSRWKNATMRPFFSLHHARYAVYWNRQTKEAWLMNPLYRDKLRAQELAKHTCDELTPGDKVSEKEHEMIYSETGSRGNLNGKSFRDAQPDQWFEYKLSTEKGQDKIAAGNDLMLMCRLSLTDKGRSVHITLDGETLTRYQVPTAKAGAGKDRFFDESFVIPNRMLKGKKKIAVRFSSENGSFVPRFYQVKLVTKSTY
ncbi:MAG: glycoside hydrolase family 127 protein [Bacteroidales bacterium]|nr:glycoside hydrolase family 127 protein [Bacteroidales bacterium]